ncbi:MAG: MarR family winged helix-turn-helix transcriptional regulator [Comamonas sp.]
MKPPLKQDFLLQQVGHCTRLAHAVVRPYYAKHMQALDLKPSEFAALSLIADNPGASQKQIAEAIMISASNMTALMDKLLARELIRRESDAADKRLALLYLTDQGQALWTQACAEVQQLERQAWNMLTAQETQQLLQLLHKIIVPKQA